VRTHNNVLIIDVKVKVALEIAEVQFADKQAEKRRWYESMVAVQDRSNTEIKYLVTEK